MEVAPGEGSWDNSTFSIPNSTFGALVFSPAKTMNMARKAIAAKRWNTDILRMMSRIAANTPDASSFTHSHAKTAIANNGANSHCTASLAASVNASSTFLYR